LQRIAAHFAVVSVQDQKIARTFVAEKKP